MANQNKQTITDKITSGLNKTASVLGAVSNVGKAAYTAAKVAAPIIRAIIRFVGNPKTWYLKYGNITPAANENRPMEPIFNTLLTKNATFGVPHFVDVEVSWRDFADTFMMDQVVTNAFRSLRKHLRSNLPYGSDLLKACIVNSIALMVMAKQVERDVHWAQYSGTNNPRWQKMYIKKPHVIGSAGMVDLEDEEYLDDSNWAYTSSVYNKFRDLYNRNVFAPAAIGEFISHYFGSLFTSSTDGHNDQYIRLKMQSMDWYDMSDEHGGKLTAINIAILTLDDVMSLLNTYSKLFAIVIADLEKAVSLSAAAICSYEEYAYYFVYDPTFLQALINGYTDDSVVTADKYVRLDRMPGVDDDLTQFLFMGGIQPADHSLSNIKAMRINSMTLKLDSSDDLEWPAEFTKQFVTEDSEPTVQRADPFGIQVTTKLTTEVKAIVEYSAAESQAQGQIPEFPGETPALTSARITLALKANPNVGLNAPTYTVNKPSSNKIVSETAAVAYYFLPLQFVANNQGHYPGALFALIYAKDFNPSVPQGPMVFISDDDTLKYYEIEIDNAELSRVADNVKRFPQTGKCGLFGSNSQDYGDYIEQIVAMELDIPVSAITIRESYPGSDIFPAGKGLINVAGAGNNGVADASISLSAVCSTGGSADYEISTNISDGTFSRWTTPTPMFEVAAVYEASNTDQVITSSLETSLGSVAAYVADVFDYHIPFAVVTKYSLLTGGLNGYVDLEYESKPILVKENYVPYFYNTLDLIPVLYLMFTSLFSFDDKKNDWGRGSKPAKPNK